MYVKCVQVLIFASAIVKTFQQNETQSATRTIRYGNHSQQPNYFCNLESIEVRLASLEAHAQENARILHSEIKQANSRCQYLEMQNANLNTLLNEFKTVFNTYQRANMSHANLPSDDLGKGLQIVITALRSVKSEIEALRQNLSYLRNTKSTSSTNSKHRLKAPENCKQVQNQGNNISGVYSIQPRSASHPFMVLCDMETKGGGWTYIQNRYKGAQDFYLDWQNYKLGFGNLGGEFWLGLEYIHQLTAHEINELVVELEDLEGRRVQARYDAFSIGSEAEGFALKVLGGYSGDAGDSLMYHAGSKFSTKDMDQDEWLEGSCAKAHTGAWWFKNCDASNPNGKYLRGTQPDGNLYQGMYWGSFHGAQYSLLKVRMMIRPRFIFK